jgi:diguanylate cyclase
MIKYRETVNQSAEFLRLALPLMSHQSAALHPISYAIWYEYVAGINKPLKAAIDDLTRNGALLDEEATADVFRKYIVDFDEQIAQRLSSGFEKVLCEMAQSAASAEDHADHFGKELEQLSAELGAETAQRSAGDGVSKLLSSTREMQGAIATLKRRLDDSQDEIRTLRQEVDLAREEALTDGLTGLCNRRGFDLALTTSLSSVSSVELAPCLLIVDIDHFKKVNDSYGHLLGDKVIRSIAKILKANIKGRDTAARYGGEEFAVLLPETTVDGALALAEKIRSMIEGSRVRRADNQQEVAQITVSLGVASYCCGETASMFIERCDSALYAAKDQGRNRVSLAPVGPQCKFSRELRVG